MTRSGKIGPVERERILSRLDEPLPPCWIRRQGADPKPVFEPVASLNPVVLGEVLRGAEVACVSLSGRSSPVMRRLLAGCLEQRGRTYLQAPTFGASDDERRLLTKAQDLLVRTGGWLDCDLLVGGRGAAALLILHAPGALDVGWIRLSGEHASAVYQLFLRGFWSAPNESFGTTGRPSLDPPFEIPPHPEKHLVAAKGKSSRAKATVVVVHSGDEIDELAVSESSWLITPAAPSFAFVKGVAPRATNVAFDDVLRLPPLCVGPSTLSVIVGRTEDGDGLLLDLSSDRTGLSGRVVAFAEAARMRFQTQARVRDGHGDVLLENASFREPPIRVDVDAGLVRAASFGDVETAEPSTFPAVDVLAREVRWRWTVRPPSRPPNASSAKLVSAWSSFDAWVQGRTEQLKRDIESLAEDRTALEKSFDGFKSFFLGASRTTDGLRRSLAEIAARKPSLRGGAGSHELRGELERIAGEVARLTEGKAQTRRAELERQQRTEHERRVAEAASALAEELPRREALDAEVTKLRAQLAELGKTPAEADDAKAAAKKLRSDLHQAEVRLGAAQRRVTELEAKARAAFVFHEEPRSSLPQKKQGPAFVPTQASAAPPVPSEDLPSVGTLLEVGSERFLSITNWDEVEPGRLEAERLKAKLVGPAEST